MKLHPTLQRELEVAFSLQTQSLTVRIVKWIIFLGAAFYFRNAPYFIHSICFALFIGFAVHFFWRYKTKGWTQSWFGWHYEKNTQS